MNAVDAYINKFEGEKKEWLTAFVTFMRENFPKIKETVSYQMPMYKWPGGYIAFFAGKGYFSFHTLDFEMIGELKDQLQKSKFGKGCAKVKYNDKEAMPVLFDMCGKIVARNMKGSEF